MTNLPPRPRHTISAQVSAGIHPAVRRLGDAAPTDRTVTVLVALLLFGTAVIGVSTPLLGSLAACVFATFYFVHRPRVSHPALVICFGVVCLYVLLSGVLAGHSSLALGVEESVRYFSYLCIFFLLWASRGRAHQLVCLFLAVTVMATLPVHVALDAFSHQGRFQSYFDHPNHLAYACVFALAAMLAAERDERLSLGLHAGAITGLLVGVLASRSSAGFIMLLIVLGLTFGQGRHLGQKIGLLVFSAVLIGVIFVTSSAFDILMQKVSAVDLDYAVERAHRENFGGYGSGMWRLTYWLAIVDAITARGFTALAIGLGAGTATAGHYAFSFMNTDPHNDYIKLLLEYGVVGGLLIFSVLLLTINACGQRFLVTAIFLTALVFGNTITNASTMLFVFLAAFSELRQPPAAAVSRHGAIKVERLFIVTPIRDEIGNVERLFEALGRSAYPIERWVVCENGSTDGTRERLYELTPPGSVRELDILHLDTETRDYALGHKYARIVNTGFERVRDTVGLAPADMIGICDADNFPRLDYYVKLARAFDADAYLGITSGIDRLLDGDESIERWDWVRGSCRLWRGACFLQSGYTIGPSADTLSLARAELDGWRSYPVQDAVFDAREVGGRVDKSYYGRSAHFRGNTPLYAVLRGAKYLAAGQPRAAAQFLGGYFRAWRTNESRIDDPELYAFFQDYVRRVLLPSAWHSLSRRRTGLSK